MWKNLYERKSVKSIIKLRKKEQNEYKPIKYEQLKNMNK